jgi:nicotinate dehydrogenase subunit A
MDKPIAFHVNGQPIEIRANPGLSLLTALRENLDLKATRVGCGAEACGACTVIVAVLARQAGQCGYCLSGILMRARALLESGEHVNRQRVAQELDANLCRCGAHGRILDAVMDAAAQMGVAK